MEQEKKSPKRKQGFQVQHIIWLVTLLLITGFRIVFTNKIGLAGSGYLALSWEISLLLYVILFGGMSRALGQQIRARVAKGYQMNAHYLTNIALIYGLIIGSIGCLISIFGDKFIMNTIAKSPYSTVPFQMFGIALLILGLMQILNGYFQGMGTNIPTLFASLLGTIGLCIGGAIGLKVYEEKGVKIAALLDHEEYSSAFQAASMPIGIISGGVLAILFLFFLFRVNKANLTYKGMHNGNKYIESFGTTLLSLLLKKTQILSGYFFFLIIVPVDLLLFMHFSKMGYDDKMIVIGNYQGRFLVVLQFFLVSFFILLSGCLKKVKNINMGKTTAVFNKVIERNLKLIIVSVIFISICISALSNTIANILFTEHVEELSIMLQVGGFIILVGYLSYFIHMIMVEVQSSKSACLQMFLCFIFHIFILLFILLRVGTDANANALSLILSNIVFYVTLLVLDFIILKKSIGLQIDYVRVVAFPCVAGLVMWIIQYLISKLLIGVIGEFLTLVVAFVIGIFVYNILLVVLHVFEKKDMDYNLYGNFLDKLANLCGLWK